MRRPILFRLFLGTCILIFAPTKVGADWPMAGQNPQRTSFAPDLTPSNYSTSVSCGLHTFEDYIPSKIHVITADLDDNPATLTNNFVYVAQASRVTALKTSNLPLRNDATDIAWEYFLTQPPGHSPTIDKTTSTIFITSLDKTIHALDAASGTKKWQTLKAGGGFTTNPLVAHNKVYAGNRDGYFYAFNADNGSYVWSYKTNNPIDFSATLSPDGNTIYFASHDAKIYALNAHTGQLLSVSAKLFGQGFYSFWPVYYNPDPNTSSDDRLIVPRTHNYPEPNKFSEIMRYEIPLRTATDSGTTADMYARFYTFLFNRPDMRTMQLFDPITLVEKEVTPFLWWGESSGNRYPPAIDKNTGTIWAMSPWYFSPTVGFNRGRYMGWSPGRTNFDTEPDIFTTSESNDESEAIAIFGNTIWHGDGGDGADRIGYSQLFSTNRYEAWTAQLFNLFGNWWSQWPSFKYSNGLRWSYDSSGNRLPYPTYTGSHGNQNPPVPLAGKAYIHRSNSLLCVQP